MREFTENKEMLLERLRVDGDFGLTQEQAAANREMYGENGFSREKKTSLMRRLMQAAGEPMTIMLLMAGFITLAVNIIRYFAGGETDFLECVGIFAAILLSTLITVAMEGRSAKAFEALSQIGEDTQIKALRKGEILYLAQKEVVVGDILFVETGDKLPADSRLLESTMLMVDESPLTGESMAVNKEAMATFSDETTPVAERSNMLYSGCFITGGSGKVVVTGVGDNTEFGKIAKELATADKGTTPLQEKMAKLGKRITLMGTSAAAIVFFIQLVRFLINDTATMENIMEAFITSIVLVVAAVPEGLPTIVAVSLAINIIKMSKQNALVKKMVACETVGCINVICSDKTGTLTENRMTVTAVYGEETVYQPEQLKDMYLIQNFCINATADIRSKDGQLQFIGNPTECALLIAAKKAGYAYEEIRKEANITHVYPFASDTKNMTTIVTSQTGAIAYSKGSPEKILLLCQMTEDKRKRVEAEIAAFQEKACRVIGFSHKELDTGIDFQQDRNKIEHHMVFDGFVAITDPLREDVYDAVEKCRSAGIDLKILTGDNIITAKAIAHQLHLLEEGNMAVEAKDIDILSDAQLIEILPKIRVIARSTPGIKMRVVNALKSTGNVVAVTGDGINDAPAIKNADVGMAMGISGTEVSKEASDIVLLDDSFSTIVKSVQWGRGIYENFQRFIQFQLTVNLSSVLVVLASIIVGFAAPFSALQILWINIVMDGPPALTLGLEPIRSDLMSKKPTKRDASIVSREMFTRIIVNGVFIAILFMIQNFTNFLGGTTDQLPTILFTLFVVFQLFNAFNSRELGNESIFKNFTTNRLMLVVFALTFALQILITQLGGAFFGTVALPFLMWIKIILVGFSVVLVSEIVKAVQRFVDEKK